MEILKDIALVRQKHRYDCGIACLVMIAGLTYDQVAADFAGIDESRGFTFHDAEYWLAEHGYAVSRKWMFKHGNVKVSPWPPAPWTEVHLAQVEIHGGSHFVVMLRDGTVLDPNCPNRTTLATPLYLKVNQVCGVHRISISI